MALTEWFSLIQTLVLFITGIVIWWYTKETKLLRETTQESLQLTEFYHCIDSYIREYNLLKLSKNLPGYTVMSGQEIVSQEYFRAILEGLQTHWMTKMLGSKSAAIESDSAAIVRDFLDQYETEINIQKYISQVVQVLKYLQTMFKKDKKKKDTFRRMFIRLLGNQELHFIYYYGITDKDLKNLCKELNIFENLKSFVFLFHETHKNYY